MSTHGLTKAQADNILHLGTQSNGRLFPGLLATHKITMPPRPLPDPAEQIATNTAPSDEGVLRYAVAVEHPHGEPNMAVWFDDLPTATQAFETAQNDYTGAQINLFPFHAPFAATNEKIAAIADALMASGEYTALQTHADSSALGQKPAGG